MPRQVKENYIRNDRVYNTRDHEELILGIDENNKVLHTDTIENLEETKKEVQGFIEEVTDLKNQLEHKDTIIRNNSNSDADKHRIQTALNTQAQEIQILNN
jgi:glucosamine 6-phosphate synthetase-like amidotransferase/phosphosugar isomerase protein